MSRKRRLNYGIGDAIAVPVRNGGYALEVIARADGRGGILGYFYGPRRWYEPDLEEALGLRPEDATLVCLHGDLGLLEGKWTVLGSLPGFNKAGWPLPHFGRVDVVDPNRAVRVEYDESTLLPARESPITAFEARKLPEDGLCGYGAVEIWLNQLLPGG